MTSIVIVDAYRQRMIDEFGRKGVEIVRVQSTVDVPAVHAGPLDHAKFIADIVYDGDLNATASAVSAYDPIAVMTGSEIGVELTDALAEKLGCAGNGTHFSEARRDKYLMVEAVRAAGLAAARQIRTTSAAELADWHAAVGGRIVVKPPRSSASDSVYFCDSVADSMAAFDGIHGFENVISEINVGVVAQEYIPGTEYIVNTVSCEGAHRVCEVWRTTRTIEGLPELADSYHLMPRAGAIQDELTGYAMKVLDALGIRHGPAHAEIRMTDNGPILIEIGARMCGDDLPYYAQVTQGESQLDWTVTAHLEPAKFFSSYRDARTESRFCSVVRLMAPASGRLIEYRKLAEIRQLQSFYDVSLKVLPGDAISRTVTTLTCPGVVILMHGDAGVLWQDSNTIRRLDDVDFYKIGLP